MSTTSTAQSEAQLRVVTIKTDTGDPVKFSGNPAELPGARHETRKALRRAGAFNLLIQYNASRLKNGVIATEDLDTISLVTQVLEDPDAASYTFERPCPGTAQRIDSINQARTQAGLAPYAGAANIGAIPDKLLKLAIPNKHEVSIEALAYALTQLSIFEDVQHANELLVACDYDGRKLGPLLDAIELEATGEDIALVTGTRDKFKEAGLKGQPLNFASFRMFFKQFNILEYRCPPDDRLADKALAQLVGSLFINDASQRKNWSNHINQPVIISPSGARLSGPPRTFAEAKLLAEKVLRSEKVLAGIDELSSPSGGVIFDASHVAALSEVNIDHRALPADALPWWPRHSLLTRVSRACLRLLVVPAAAACRPSSTCQRAKMASTCTGLRPCLFATVARQMAGTISSSSGPALITARNQTSPPAVAQAKAKARAKILAKAKAAVLAKGKARLFCLTFRRSRSHRS